MEFNQDRILIVGGAGYIGSHVALAFHEAGAAVTVFDNLSTGWRSNIVKGIAFVQGDIQDRDALANLFVNPWDGVIHLAALKAAGESMSQPELYARQNLIGSLNLLEAYAAKKKAKFILSSSAAVYGDPIVLPMDETHPKVPVNFYGYTKLAIEEYLHWYARLRGLTYGVLRYFNAAGYDAAGRITGLEKNPQNLIPLVMEAAIGKRKLQVFGDDYDTVDGSGVRDYVHVSDLARGHLAAYAYMVESKKSIQVNLGTGKGYSVLEVIQKTNEIAEMEIPYKIVSRREGDPATVFASAKLAAQLMGWKAQESDLHSMIESTWRIYKKQ